MSLVFTVHFVSGSYILTTQGKKQKFMRIIARSHGFNNGSGLHLDQLIVTGILRNLTGILRNLTGILRNLTGILYTLVLVLRIL